MTMKRYIVLGCALCWPAMVALAAPTGLLDFYRKAKVEDPGFSAARSIYQAGLKDLDVGRAGLLPSVSAGVSSTRTRYGLATPTAPWTEYDFTARAKTIQLNQTVFDWDKISAYNEASARTVYAEAAFAEAKADLILRVAQGYFNYLLDLDNVDLAVAQKNALAQQRMQAEKLHQSGAGTITDEEETKSRHEIAEAQWLTAISSLEVRKLELAKMVGSKPADVRRIAGQVELAPPEPRVIAAWLEAGSRQNLKVISQQANLKVAEAQVDRARAGHLPSLTLMASYRKGDEPNYFSIADEDKRVGLQLSIPLFEGGKVLALSEQAVYQKEKARNDLESAIRDSQIRVSQSFLGVVNGIAQVKALEQAVKSSETALKGMEVGQRTGLRTNTDVLNAQQQFFSAMRDLQRQRYNYLLSRLQLAAAVGTLGDEDVELIDRLVSQTAGKR